jgi:hypothetical protein
MHFPLRQQRLIWHNAADLVFAGDVFAGKNADDAGLLLRERET